MLPFTKETLHLGSNSTLFTHTFEYIPSLYIFTLTILVVYVAYFLGNTGSNTR